MVVPPDFGMCQKRGVSVEGDMFFFYAYHGVAGPCEPGVCLNDGGVGLDGVGGAEDAALFDVFVV